MLSKEQVYGIASGTVVVVGLLNLLPIAILAHIFVISSIFQLLAAVVLIVMLPLVAPLHQPASYVFGAFYSPLSITNTPSQVRRFQHPLAVYPLLLHVARSHESALTP